MKKSYSKAQNWSFYHCLQMRALQTAESIYNQLLELLREVEIKKVEKYFDFSNHKLERNQMLRCALSQGFFMQTCRKVNDGKDGS